jgi:hypothetical protein
VYSTVNKFNFQFSISKQNITQFRFWQKLTFITVIPHTAVVEADEEFLDCSQSLHINGVWGEGPYQKPVAGSETEDHNQSHTVQHLLHRHHA